MSTLALSSTIVEAFDNVALTKYFAAIGFTIVCWDTLLTLPDEIRLIWPERWSLVKALFYANRVVSFIFIALNTYHLTGLAPAFSNTFCQVLIMTTGYGAIIAFGIANWLLLARATALWGGTRKIVWTMTIFYLVTYIATISIATVASRQIVDDIFYAPPVKTCAITVRPTTFGAIWVPSVIFEMALFGMLFTKLFSHARVIASGGTCSKLISTLHRDGIVYFVVIFCLRLFNLIAWSALPLSLVFIGIFLLWSCTTVLLTRLHLNLKALGAEPRSEEDLGNNVNMPNINVSIQFRHSTPISLPLTNSPSPVPPPTTAAKKGKKKLQWRRRDPEMESFYNQVETNIFPGGTAIYTRDPDYLGHDNVARTRPGTAV